MKNKSIKRGAVLAAAGIALSLAACGRSVSSLNTSDKPLYQQIKDQIKDAILKEELKQGDSLPSIRAFANDLKVSVLTIRRVYEELEQEGFVISQVGIGTSVSASNLELLRDSKRRLVEEKMIDMIQTAKTLKISKEELNTMMDILYGED